MELPVIDLNYSSSPDSETAKQLVNSISQYGFVYIKNNCGIIPPKDIDLMFDLSKKFFKSPEKIKSPYKIHSGSSGKNSGWFPMRGETLDPSNQVRGDFKEAFNMNEFRNGRAQQPLPSVLSEHENHLNEFSEHCRNLCLSILRYFAVGLDIETEAGGHDFFTQFHDRSGPSGSVFRLLYYPAMSQEYDGVMDIRAGAHSDYGSITLLFQRPGQPGLEILTDSGANNWYPVPVNPTNEPELPILVNVGDLLSHWTNGLLKSAVHRVVFPSDGTGGDRYSIAYFCHPIDDAALIPVPSQVVGKRNDETQNRRLFTAKEHLESRLAATIAWDGKHEK